jgi:long-chain acyl-CoA synthetase
MLALLPVWHITERTFELWMISRGCCITYSSIRTFKEDLAKHQPQWLVLVPRVLEKIAIGVQDKFSSGGKLVKLLVKFFTAVGGARASHLKISKGLIVGDSPPDSWHVYRSQMLSILLTPLHSVGNKIIWRKVQDGFGGRVKVIICGGSALASSLDTFYEICGVPICVGYGLTECSPLLAHRRKDRNLVSGGCVGQPCIDTEIRIVDPEIDPNSLYNERPSLPQGQIGLIVCKGPQVTKGYYNNKEATTKAIDRFGFFDTGDLGRMNPATGDLIITGRCKDTIVLSNGENIEPSPIEDAILGQIPMIQQVMLTGQDGRSLIAIVVLNIMELIDAGFLDVKMGKSLQKDFDRVNDPKCTEDDCAGGCTILNDASKALRKNSALIEFLMSQIGIATAGFRKWEQVGNIYVTLEPFSMCNSLLTQSYKVKRDAVLKRYASELHEAR